MTWRSFVGYVVMRELGQADAVQRNYLVEFEPYSRGGDWITLAVSASERMGLDTSGVHLNALLNQVRAMLANVGYNVPDLDWLERTMCAWYTWDRLNTGSLRRWPRRPIANPLI